MRKIVGYVLAAALMLLLIALWCVRFAAFSVLMFLRPVITGVLSLASTACLIGLVGGAIITQGQHPEMLWTFLGFGIGSGVLLYCYDSIVLILAPDSFPILLFR